MKMKMENSEDQLSALSDDILIKILSLLPIKTAVATSVLSRRWINLWTHITAFDLPETAVSESGNTSTPSNLNSIVDDLLPKLNSPVISTFTLVADDNTNINPDSINSWIQLLCARNVQYINLTYLSDDAYASLSTTCLFQCRSLVSLSLCSHRRSLKFDKSIYFDDIEVDLPNLKILVIDSLVDYDLTLMAKLFKSCPRLEELRIFGYFSYPGLDYNTLETPEAPVYISGQYLRSLFINIDHYECYDNVVVYIDAPNLKILKVEDISCLQFRFISKPTRLTKAKCNCTDYNTFHNIEWLEVISGVSSLKIDEGTLMYVFLIEDYEVPIFSNLTKLVTLVSTIDSWKTLFLRLLDCTPNLEFLDINLLCFSDVYPMNKVDDSTNLFPQALLAPSCLVHHVKKMKFQINGILRCLYQELELEVVKYMISHARALEELVIEVHCSGIVRGYELQLHEELELYHFYENLRDLPRSLGVHCSVTLKFVLCFGIRLVFPHQMEYEDGCDNSSPSLDPDNYYSAPPITLKESFSI